MDNTMRVGSVKKERLVWFATVVVFGAIGFALSTYVICPWLFPEPTMDEIIEIVESIPQ